MSVVTSKEMTEIVNETDFRPGLGVKLLHHKVCRQPCRQFKQKQTQKAVNKYKSGFKTCPKKFYITYITCRMKICQPGICITGQ
jgi:hypothetical protein